MTSETPSLSTLAQRDSHRVKPEGEASSKPQDQPEDQSFPKRLRLRRRGSFLKAQRIGKRVYTPHLIAYLVLGRQRPTRIGLTVSKKVGKAHRRNLVKRVLREAFRRSQLRQSIGFDISIIARQERAPLELEPIIKEMNQLAQKGLKLMSEASKLPIDKSRRDRNGAKPSKSKRDKAKLKPNRQSNGVT